MSKPQQPAERIDGRRFVVLLRQRVRQGRRRARIAFMPILTSAIAAGLAWAVAYHWLGHEQPFFAPVAAWVCLGFTADRQVRKVGELAIGVTLGVALGEAIAILVGTGALQIILVIVVAAMLARFVDRGAMLTVQAGVQGIVIVALPALSYTDGAAGRWLDALIGGSFALVIAALTPRDARRRARKLARASMSDLSQMLRKLSRGLAEGDEQLVRDALVEGRGTQGVLDEWAEVVRNARQSVRFSPASRLYLPELARLQRASMLADRAMRNARVITRRGLIAVEQGEQDEEVAQWIAQVASAARQLGTSLAAGVEATEARAELAMVARSLAPQPYDDAGWRLQTLVVLMRSLTVDLLQATGMTAAQASALLADDDAVEVD